MIKRTINTSTSPYLATLIIGSIAGLWAGYLRPAEPIAWGQSAAVILPLVGVGISSLFWLFLDSRPRLTGWPLLFMTLLGIAWVVSLGVFRYHGDAFTYGALAFLPLLAMISMKPPSTKEGVTVLLLTAWALSFVLLATRLLQIIGLVPVKSQPIGVIAFDEANYWLPFNAILGIEGRWPGPFGHNGYTAMMGAFVLVIAIVFWARRNWVLLVVGSATLMVTGGRASIGAFAAGVIAFAMFTRAGRLGRIPRQWRIGAGLLVLIAGLLVLLKGPSGLTGRQNIWPAFWELWLTSPALGVGSSGIVASGGLTQKFGHAHSMYLDLLARNGLVVFVVVMVALVLGFAICVASALWGQPGPLALLISYLITAITEPRNDWLHPGTLVLLTTLSVLTAAAFLREDSDARWSNRANDLTTSDSR